MSTLVQPYTESLQAAVQFIREGDDFLVVSHLSPDGDAISSTSAIGLILESLGKRYRLINEGHTPDKYRLLLAHQPISDYSSDEPKERYERVISVDCADYARIGNVHRLFAEGVQLLNIDHHPTNDHFGAVNLIRTDAAATVEIIYELAEALEVNWTKPLANCVYAGLLTDTGGFRYSNTTSNVLAVAERMLRQGAEGALLSERLLETMTYAQIQLLREALATMSFTEDRRIAWMCVSTSLIASLGANDEDTEGLVNLPRNVEGVEVGMLFKQRNELTVKVSLRSAGKVDVSQIAKRFGGGGHVRASGCTVTGEIDDIVQKFVEAVNAEL